MVESIEGPIYEHRKTKQLLSYLPKESIVFLWHEDLDGVAVDGLIKAKVKAVINGKASMSGHYSHHHVKTLIEAGITVFDVVNLTEKQGEYMGETALVVGNKLYIVGEHGPLYVACLLGYTHILIEQKLINAKLNYSKKFNGFVQNTLTYAESEREWFQTKPQFPAVLQKIVDKEVFIVARNSNYEKDIRAVSSSMKRKEVIVIAVDGAADGLLRYRIRPDFIIGDMDSVSENALRCGAHLLCHEHPNGYSPGKNRLMKMGIQAETVRFVGTSEDVAITAAYWSGAVHLFLIGCRIGMTEFLEKGREGMGATWLCRMQAGERITDLKGIHKIMGPKPLFSANWSKSRELKQSPLEYLFRFVFDRIPFVKKKEVFRHD